jgi:hypothetical protein
MHLIYNNNYRSSEQIGEPVIFQWVEKVREFLHFCTVEESKTNIPASEEMATDRSLPELEDDFPVAHGEPLAAGKCTFQGHTASVQNITQVK